jgi:branched-chain amino acid aminotransferase
LEGRLVKIPLNTLLSFNLEPAIVSHLNFINLNGKLLLAAEAAPSVDNGAFRYGYGLFETMLVADNAIRLKAYHWERLFAGMEQLYFEVPPLMTAAWLEEQVLRTVKKNKLEKLCRVRLQVFAAGGGLYSVEKNQPGFIIECFALEPAAIRLNENGLTIGIATGLNKAIDTLSNLKSCNALIYAIAAKQARENKWNDALVYNCLGNLIESTIANVFWIKNKVIYTPPLADGCIAGVMRRHLMQKTLVVEKSLSVDVLLSADEVFLTNAIRNIRWVGQINQQAYTNIAIKYMDELARL